MALPKLKKGQDFDKEIKISSILNILEIFDEITEGELEIAGKGYDNNNVKGIVIYPKNNPAKTIELFIEK